jgi:hypothetical protein
MDLLIPCQTANHSATNGEVTEYIRCVNTKDLGKVGCVNDRVTGGDLKLVNDNRVLRVVSIEDCQKINLV